MILFHVVLLAKLNSVIGLDYSPPSDSLQLYSELNLVTKMEASRFSQLCRICFVIAMFQFIVINIYRIYYWTEIFEL